jgi:hypothetical protein
VSAIIVPTPVLPVTQSSSAIQPVSAAITPSEPIAGVPSIFTQLGFTSVQSKYPSLIIGLEGGTGSGKTRFLTTCPPPIGVIDFDKGMKGVAETDIWGNRIVRKTLEMPDFDDRGPEDRRGTSAPAVSAAQQSVARQSYEQFKQIISSLLKSLGSGGGGTICIDNLAAIYTCAMAARFGQLARLGDVPAQMWRMMKVEFEQILTDASDYPVNLVVTQRQKEKFGEKGVKEADGWRDLIFNSDVYLVMEKKLVPKSAADPSGIINPLAPIVIEPPDVYFSARVLKVRPRYSQLREGQELQSVWLDQGTGQSMGLDFLTIAKQVVPGTTDQDWIRR